MKEAITQLTGLKKYCEGMAECDESGSYVFDLDVQALDMAITALSPPNEPLTMAKLRARIDRDPAAMEKLMRKLNRQKELVLETEDYKRPRAPAPSKLLEPWYRARSFTICHNDKLTDELFSRDIVERLRQDFTFLLPYYDYFVTLEGDPDPRDAG